MQTVGGAFFVSAAQSAFLAELIKKLGEIAPHVDPMRVILTGATEIRNAFSPEDVPFVVESYMEGVKVAFVLAIVGAGIGILVSPFSRWKRLNTEAITGGGAA
jgi:MFS transporter, DHA2 family, glioxin efflux transporter